jgi:hypothetical protein
VLISNDRALKRPLLDHTTKPAGRRWVIRLHFTDKIAAFAKIMEKSQLADDASILRILKYLYSGVLRALQVNYSQIFRILGCL